MLYSHFYAVRLWDHPSAWAYKIPIGKSFLMPTGSLDIICQILFKESSTVLDHCELDFNNHIKRNPAPSEVPYPNHIKKYVNNLLKSQSVQDSLLHSLLASWKVGVWVREIYKTYGNVVGMGGPEFPPKAKLQLQSLPSKPQSEKYSQPQALLVFFPKPSKSVHSQPPSSASDETDPGPKETQAEKAVFKPKLVCANLGQPFPSVWPSVQVCAWFRVS